MRTKWPWITRENIPWLINGEDREWKQNWNILEINLTKKEVVISSYLPEGMELNSFPEGATIEVNRQRCGRRSDYSQMDYTGIALFNCSLLECRIVDPVMMWGVEISKVEDSTEIRATIKYESMEFQADDQSNKDS